MKSKLLILSCIALCIFSCTQTTSEHRFLTLDLNQSYPSKELFIQDIAKVSYSKLEVDSTWLIPSHRTFYASKKYVGFVDNRTGDIFFYHSDTGKKAFHINRKGQGPEEYMATGIVTLDEKNMQLYVWSTWEGVSKVYDVEGKYLKTLPLRNYKKGEYSFVDACVDINDEYMLCSHLKYGSYVLTYLLNKNNASQSILIDSVPQSEIIDKNLVHQTESGMTAVSPEVMPIMRSDKGIIFADYSNDTIYRITDEYEKVPYIVRTPSVKSETPHTILRYDGETTDWIFLTSIELHYDFEAKKGLKEKHYGIHKDSRKIYEVELKDRNIGNGGYVPLYKECICLSAHQLMDLLDDNQLSGELKHLASELNEDDNGVLMLIH